MKNSKSKLRPMKLPPEMELGKMILGAFTNQLIYVAAKLDLADHLKDGDRPIDYLAKETGSEPDALFRIMRALSGLGIFKEIEKKHFALTPMAACLLTDSPVSQKNLALLMGSRYHNLAWSNLLYSVQTGKSGFEKEFDMDFMTYLVQNHEDLAIFQQCMAKSSIQETKDLCNVYDFSSFKTIIDVGGGQGDLLEMLLSENPRAKGILYDLPAVIEETKDINNSEKFEDRFEKIGGDFFKNVPKGGDLYILKRIIHDWDDNQSITILKNCNEAMNRKGKIILLEEIILPGNDPSLGKLADIEMLVMSSGGRERTNEEFESLCSNAGLVMSRVIPLKSGNIIEMERLKS